MSDTATAIPRTAAPHDQDSRRHALVIGGTGMLAGVSIALSKQYERVSVLARTVRSLERLREATPPMRVHPLRCDWHDLRRLRTMLGEALDAHGGPTLVVCWCHTTSPDAPLVIANMVADDTAPVRYIHVLGSGSPRASEIRARWTAALGSLSGINYQTVQLGCERIGRTFRWLAHEQICDGVLAAIESGALHTFVGDPIP